MSKKKNGGMVVKGESSSLYKEYSITLPIGKNDFDLLKIDNFFDGINLAFCNSKSGDSYKEYYYIEIDRHSEVLIHLKKVLDELFKEFKIK